MNLIDSLNSHACFDKTKFKDGFILATNDWQTMLIDDERREELDDHSESIALISQTLFYINKEKEIIRVRLDQPELVKETIVTEIR